MKTRRRSPEIFMRSQRKEQKTAEMILRRELLEYRSGKKSGRTDHKTADRDFYINSWILPQISRLEKVLDTIGPKEIDNRRILELGSESGHISAFIHNNFKARLVVASDIADSLIEALPFVASCLGFEKLPKTVILDNHRLSFADGSFDFIFGLSVLHHVAVPALILKEVRRVLSSGGLAVFLQEPFLPVYLLPLQFFYSRSEKKTGICESVFSLRDWFSFVKDFEVVEAWLEAPEFLKRIVPDNSFVYRYITGGGLGLILRKR